MDGSNSYPSLFQRLPFWPEQTLLECLMQKKEADEGESGIQLHCKRVDRHLSWEKPFQPSFSFCMEGSKPTLLLRSVPSMLVKQTILDMCVCRFHCDMYLKWSRFSGLCNAKFKFKKVRKQASSPLTMQKYVWWDASLLMLVMGLAHLKSYEPYSCRSEAGLGQWLEETPPGNCNTHCLEFPGQKYQMQINITDLRVLEQVLFTQLHSRNSKQSRLNTTVVCY